MSLRRAVGVVRIEFFDPLNNLISAADVGLGFYGWEHAPGIRRVRLTDILNDGRIFTFDDLTVETVPEPGSASLLALGLLGLSRRWIKGSRLPVCTHYSSACSSSVPPGVAAMAAHAREPDDLGSARRLGF
jgi:PEP-CTERM motif